MSSSARATVAALALCLPGPCLADADKAAAAFGARPDVTAMTMSPDGSKVAYVAPAAGQGSLVYTLSLADGAQPRVTLASDGKPERIRRCDWAANERLICEAYGVIRQPQIMVGQSSLIAVDLDGSHQKALGKPTDENSHSNIVYGTDGEIIDWLPDEDGAVLMTRVNYANDHVGSRLGSTARGLSVDRVDTRTLSTRQVEPANASAVRYLTDQRGTVRIMAVQRLRNNMPSSLTTDYLYRTKGARDWRPLSSWDYAGREGFSPVAVDANLDAAYGFKTKDGRLALYRVSLDGSLTEALVYSREDADLTRLVRLGRRQRVIGVSWGGGSYIFDDPIRELLGKLSKALPGQPALSLVDASADEQKLLLFASSDRDAGVYYVFDRATKRLRTFLVARSPLEGMTLAGTRPVEFQAADGTPLAGRLTLPPGKGDAKGLPGIVLPAGGSTGRDARGFNWLVQYYAARGYAVLQLEPRDGSDIDRWFRTRGFKSWPTAAGDLADGARWLVGQGVERGRLAAVGWSYGGYAALQAAVAEPQVFKAVVAIAAPTDLPQLVDERRLWSDFEEVKDIVGSGPHVASGSPARNAQKIKASVFLVHGTDDIDVDYQQSVTMDRALGAANVEHRLVSFLGLDHQLEDSAARAQLLRESDAFLRKALAIP